jgi:glycosyltransferase involved in cell wall biosynthesis
MLTTNMLPFPTEAISKNVLILSDGLRRMGHEVKIFTIFGSSEEFKKYLTFINPMAFPNLIVSSQKRLENELEAFHPDFTLTHFGLIGTNFLLSKTHTPHTIPFVYPYPSSVKDCLLLNNEIIRSNIPCKLNHFFRFFSTLCLNNTKIYEMSLKKSSFAIFSSKDLCQSFGKYVPKSKFLNLALSDEEILHSEHIIQNRMIYRKKWNLREKDVVIGFLGHPSLMKGIDLAIKTFVNLSAGKKRKTKMLLATSPLGAFNVMKLIKTLPRTTRETIEIHGHVRSIEFIGVLDLLLFPLRSHIGTTAVPRTLLESILVGTPFVVGDVSDSVRELVSGLRNGSAATSSLPNIIERSNEILGNQESFREKILENRDNLIHTSHVTKVAKQLEGILLEQGF